MTLSSRSLGITLAILALPLSASASLGGDAASVQADQRQMNGTLRTTAAAKHTQFEIQTPTGILAREYVSSTGLVFAVVWEGPSLPDLRQLLGSYFSQYIQAANAADPAARPRVIEQPGLVVYSGGRMRAFLGRAFVPDLIPKGLSLDEIR